jgi:hypothetical protein
MGRANYIQQSFTAGEINKKLYRRTDLDKYSAALKEATNAICLPQGPIGKRPGFRYVAAAKYADKAARLIDFEFNVEQTYALEFGDQYIRFFTNESQLLDSITGKDFTNGTFASDISGWTSASSGTGSISWSAGVLRLVSGTAGNEARAYQQLVSGLGLATYTVTLDVGTGSVNYKVGTTANTSGIASGTLTAGVGKTFNFTLTAQSDVFVTFENATASATHTIDNVVLTVAATPFEIDSPYLEAELFEIKYTQSADILYIAHPSHPIMKLSRLAAARWTLTELDFIDGPYDDINADVAKTLSTSAAGARGTAVTVTASGHTPFASTDVGRVLRQKRGGKWRSIKITSFSSSTSVGGVFQDDNPSGYTAGSTSDWRLGEWSDTTGWPEVITFYQQRLTLGKDQTVYGSESGDFESFSPSEDDGTVTDSNGFVYRLASDQVNRIVWLSASKVLAIGTIGGEWIMKAGTLSNPEAITPTNVIVTRETSYGSSQNVNVSRPGSNVAIFVDRTARKLREFIYNYEVDGYTAPELTLLSRHVTKSGTKDVAFAEGIQWIALNNGLLVSMTYLREQKVVGFAQHNIGGAFGSSNAFVESITSIISSDLAYEQLWALTKRTIDGATVRYIEYLEDDFDPEDEDDKDNAFFVDCGLTYDGSATNTITGLDHLEGQTVAVLADGAVRPNKTVSSGSISLGSTTQTQASVVQVGLPFTFRIRTLDPEIGGDAGTSQGKIKRIEEVVISFVDTLGAKVGRDVDNLDDINFRNADDPMNESPPLYTGYKKIIFEDEYKDETSVVIQSDQPTPITVAAVLPSLIVHEQ